MLESRNLVKQDYEIAFDDAIIASVNEHMCIHEHCNWEIAYPFNRDLL